MITKRIFCISIIAEYLSKNHIKCSWKDISESEILKSSSLAVAMEYLGLLKSQTMKEYAESRDGIFKLCIDEEASETNILSTREMIDLLPETFEEWQK